jgi:cell division protein FtsB
LLTIGGLEGANDTGHSGVNLDVYMGWLKKKNDPLTERARSLNAEIAMLEAQIKRLDTQLQRGETRPRLRSTAIPHGATIAHAAEPAASPPPVQPASVPKGPVFEDVDQERLKARADATSTPDYYNELGVRKYDLPALLRRVRNLFRGPTTMNPRLMSYLAAGGIQGLRPMRYEKRVARNRFIALVIFLFLLLFGILWMFVRNR